MRRTIMRAALVGALALAGCARTECSCDYKGRGRVRAEGGITAEEAQRLQRDCFALCREHQGEGA